MEEKIKNIFIWFGIIIFYLIMQIIMPSILDTFNITNTYITNTCLVLSDVVITALLILFYKKDFKEGHDDLNKNYKDKISITIKIWLIGLVLMVISNNIINLFTANGIASNESLANTLEIVSSKNNSAKSPPVAKAVFNTFFAKFLLIIIKK